MSDLAERVRAIGEQVEAGYDDRQTEAAWACLRTKLHRRRVRRIALGSTVGLLCLFTVTLWTLRVRYDSRMRTSAAHSEALFALRDGSVVMPLAPTSRLELVGPGAGRVRLRASKQQNAARERPR